MLALLLLSFVSDSVHMPPHVGMDHAVPVSIEFAADGASVFSIREDGIVQRWSLETGDLLSSFGSTELRFRSTAVSPDGRAVASGDEEGVLRIWEADEIAPTRVLQAHRSPISRIVWSPDGRRFATFGYQRDMALWDVATGKSIARFSSLDENGTCACAAFTPDGRVLVFSVGEEFVRVCSAESGELLRTLAGNDGGVSALCLSPNGRLLAATTSGGCKACGLCHIWNLEAGEELAALGRESPGDDGQFDAIVLARFSDDGSELTTLDAFGFVEVRCAPSLEVHTSFQIPGWEDWPPTSVVRAREASELGLLSCDARAPVRIHPSGRLILTVSEHLLSVFDARTLDLRLTRIEYEKGNWLCLTPDFHFSGTPSAEAWARVAENRVPRPPLARLDPSLRDSAAIRKSLTGE